MNICFFYPAVAFLSLSAIWGGKVSVLDNFVEKLLVTTLITNLGKVRCWQSYSPSAWCLIKKFNNYTNTRVIKVENDR